MFILRYQDTAKYTIRQLQRLAENWGIPTEGSTKMDLRKAIMGHEKNQCSDTSQRVFLVPECDAIMQYKQYLPWLRP